MVIIVIIVSIGGYALGQFSASEEKVTTTSSTTITQTETITTTSTWNITETLTSTTVNGRVLPIPSPANSTAVIRSHLIFNGTILVTYSIDKPSYSIGEIVHIRTTITNLTPNNMTVLIMRLHIDVMNSTNNLVWTTVAGILGPYPGNTFDLSPGETKILEKYMSADWNMKGRGGSYNNLFVPEGQYTVNWYPDIAYTYSGSRHWEDIHETIPFTITK